MIVLDAGCVAGPGPPAGVPGKLSFECVPKGAGGVRPWGPVGRCR